MFRRVAMLMCVGVLHACEMGTSAAGKRYACSTNTDCAGGFVCLDGVCEPRELYFARLDGGPDASVNDDGGCIEACAGGDAGTPDAGTPDSGTSDAGAGDAGSPDGGAADGGAPDAGPADAGCDAGTGVELCGDGVDNNCNALVDCAELTCATMGCGLNGRVCTGMSCVCGGGGAAEASELTCNDARDNDCDGQTDCIDSTCSGRTCGANGRTCSGTSCTCSGNGGAAQATESTCNDTRDNDCDGQTDCADSSCAGQVCGAGMGRTCVGTSCTCSGNGGTAEASENTCSDTRDNDCDGQTDCADSNCSGRTCGANGRTCSGTSCTCSGNGGTPEASETLCSDGRDNDCDGLTDSADPTCAAATPDGGAYAQSTSAQAFIDACSQAGFTRHTFGDEDDDTTGVLTMPFPFVFWGVTESDYWLSTNGLIGFNMSPDDTTGSSCLPSMGNPRPAIYAHHDDLITTNGICTVVQGSAPNRKLIVTWPNMDHFDYPTANMTFSAILSETTNTIDLVYSTMMGSPDARGVGGVTGLSNGAGTRASEYDCHTAGYLTTGLAIRFTPL